MGAQAPFTFGGSMSVISICNSALIKIGGERIAALSDDTLEGQLCNEQYDKLRDEVLRAHPWNFAIRRVSLAKTATVPAFEFENEYQLPSDVLRVLRLENQDSRFKIEGDKLLCNDDDVKILYIAREEDTTKYDAIFKEALALRMAAEFAYSLVQSSSLQQNMTRAYQMMLRDARTADAQEGTPDKVWSDDWLSSRL
jgi:hypothetical protein